MAKLYFGASKGKSFISKIIKWFQWGIDTTHIFYILEEPFSDNPLVIEAWHEPLFKGGVRRGYFFDENNYHTKGTKWDIYSLEVTDNEKEIFEKNLTLMLGMGYDLRGILGFATRLQTTHSKDKVFCSEAMILCLQSIDKYLLRDTSPQETTPAMFCKSPLLKLEKRG